MFPCIARENRDGWVVREEYANNRMIMRMIGSSYAMHEMDMNDYGIIMDADDDVAKYMVAHQYTVNEVEKTTQAQIKVNTYS